MNKKIIVDKFANIKGINVLYHLKKDGSLIHFEPKSQEDLCEILEMADMTNSAVSVYSIGKPKVVYVIELNLTNFDIFLHWCNEKKI